VNLVQPSNLGLRLSKLLHDAFEARSPLRIFSLPLHDLISKSKLRRARLLQGMDGRMKPLNLPAQLLLLEDAPVHPVQIECHEFLPAIDEFLRQETQQRKAPFEQLQVSVQIMVHGLRHFVELVFVSVLRRTEVEVGSTRGIRFRRGCDFCARLRGWLVLGPGVRVGNRSDARR